MIMQGHFLRKNFLLSLLATLIIVAAFFTSPSEAKDAVDGSFVKSDLCPDSPPLRLEMGEVMLATPRSTGIVIRTSENGKRRELTHTNGTIACDTETVKNVWQFSLTATTLLRPYRDLPPGTGKPVQTQYGFEKRTIEDAYKNGKVQTLQTGIVKIANQGVGDLFILPIEKAPTGDGKPVVLDCSRDLPGRIKIASCMTIYMHRSGLMHRYSFRRSDFPTDNFLDAHARKIKCIEQMIIPISSTPK